MQIEEGKYYKTRDGRKVGPVKRWLGVFEIWGEKCSEGNDQLWLESGEVLYKRPGEEVSDLIEEVTL